MNKKIGILIFSIGFAALLVYGTYEPTQPKAEDRMSEIMDKAWEEYDVLASMVNTDSSEVYFRIEETEDEDKLKNMLQKSLKKADLEEYSIVIEKRNDPPSETHRSS